jgi:hypothetical protein
MSSRPPEFDARHLIRVTTSALVEEHHFADGSLNWAVYVTHDYDGYTVGLLISDAQRVLTIAEAHDLGAALLIASASADAWNRVRSQAN